MSKYLIYIGLLIAGFNSISQTPLTGGSSVTIDRVDIKLDTTERVFSPAKHDVIVVKEEVKKVDFDYNYNPDIYTKNISTKVAIYRLKIAQEDNSKKGFLKLGVGNYAASLLDGYYGTRANDKLAWSIGVNHLGAVNGPVNKKESGYSDNKISLKGKCFLKKYLVSGGIQYRRNVNKNYGYFGVLDQYGDSLINNNFHAVSTKNTAQDVNFKLGLKSIDLKNSLQFKLDLEPRYFKLNDSLSEFDINTKFSPEYKLSTGKIKLQSSFDINQLSSSEKLSRSLLHLRPSFEYISEDTRLLTDIGLIFDISNDTTLSKKVAAYPYLKGSYLLVDDLGLFVKGELSGGLNQQTLSQTYRDNMWINQFTANTSNIKLDIKTSLEASPVENLITKVKFRYATIDNFNSFINNSSDLSYYLNTYTNSTVNLVSPGFEISYRFKGGHGVNLDLDYMNYSTEESIFYLPSLSTNLELFYKLKNNFKISSDISYISGLVGVNALDASSEELGSILDLNLKFDYEFNEKIGIFLYGNNLLNKKYNYYKYYPVQGINILGGIKISF